MNNHQDKDIWQADGLPKPIQPDEDVVLVVRQDVSFLIFKLFQVVVIEMGILFIRLVLLGYLDAFGIAVYDMFWFTINALLILYFTLQFHNYYLSLQIITNLRVIDIEQNGLFSRKANQLAIKNIENITYRQSGFWPSVLNYGDVIVETAGKQDPTTQGGGFVFDQVPRPADIVNTLKSLNAQDRLNFAKISAQANAESMKKVLNERLTEK